jgi:hypothetical protein
VEYGYAVGEQVGTGKVCRMSEDGLFYEGDPFDDPAWKATEKASKKAKSQTLDFVGCPMAWLEQVLPLVRGESQLAVALLLYRRWVLCGRRRTFDFPNGDLNKLNIKRATKHCALAKLEQAGLIDVERRPGHAVRITRRWR